MVSSAVSSETTTIFVEHRGGHTAWVNSLALKLTKVDDNTPDPAGGKYDRDPASGHLTGHVRENAKQAFQQLIPTNFTRADHREGVRPVPAPGAQQPVDRLAHRGDRPAERAPFGRGIAGVQPVPRDPAAGRAEARVLPARGKQHAALLTIPAVGHHPPCYA